MPTVFKSFPESAQFPDTAFKVRVRYLFRRQGTHSLRQREPSHRNRTLRYGILPPADREADNQVWAPSYHDPKDIVQPYRSYLNKRSDHHRLPRAFRQRGRKHTLQNLMFPCQPMVTSPPLNEIRLMCLTPLDDIADAPARGLAYAGRRHLICRLFLIAEIFFSLESRGDLFIFHLHYKF